MSEQHALLNYLVQKNAKKQHLYIKNNNSSPTIRLSPHVTNLHHSNFFCMHWRDRGGVNMSESAFIN